MNAVVVRSCRTIARVCGALAVSVGLFGFLGWCLDAEPLKAVLIGGVTIKANAAICLVLLGAAMLLLVPEAQRNRWRVVAGRVAAAVAMVVGGLTLVQHLGGYDFGIDQLLFREPPGARGTASPGRMGPPAAVGFFLSGLALLLLDVRTRRGAAPAQWLALLVGVIALVPLIGYAYSIQSLYGVAKYSGIAVHTAVAVAGLAVGLLAARPTVGLMVQMSADDPGGEMARRMVVPAILIPLALGWVRTAGERAGLYDAAFGRTLLVVSLIVAFALLVWWNARGLSALGRGRARAEEARRMSEFRWQRLVEQSPLSTQVFAPDGTVRQVNAAWERLWGIGLADVPGYNILQDQQLVERGIMPAIRRAFAGEAATAEPIPYVLDRGRYAGQPRWCGAYVYPVKDDQGRVEEVVLVHNDVTEQRIAEEAVRGSEQRLRSLVEQSAAGIAHTDLTGRILFANERYRQIVGYPMDELLGMRVHDLTHPEDLARTTQLVAGGAATGDEYAMEKRYVRKDGSTVWVTVSASVIKDEAGKPRSIMGVVVDVSGRKRAEEELRAQSAITETVTNNAAEALYLLDVDGLVTFSNPAAEAIFGWTRGEMLGKKLHDLIHYKHPDGRAFPMSECAVGQCFLSGRTLHNHEDVFFHRDGTPVPVLCSMAPIRHDGRLTGAVLAVIDLSERKRAEERFRILFERAAVGMAEVDLDGNFVRVNPEYGRITGYAPEELAGRHTSTITHPDDLATDRIQREATVRAAGGTVRREKRYIRKDGATVWVDLGVTLVRDEAGQPSHLIASVAETTARRQAEDALRQAKEQAERSSAAKSEFLATLSHELRTPLTPVLLTVSLMESNPALPDALRADVATIRRNVELESRLISDLLDLTRITNDKLQLDEQDVDLHLIVRSAVDICQREASARLTLDLAAARHTVRGDNTRLQQIFWNLINNAIKFTPADGLIRVRSENVGDGRVRIEVSDTGAGIDPAVLPRLFAAFEQGEVRAARQQAGLGLGLAISKKLAEAHGGTISAHSDGRGRGATFAVELPVVDAFAPAATALSHRPALELGTALSPSPSAPALRVLLVEDHEPTLRVMERLLRQIGHRVIGVTTVASATAAANHDGFDLIISDLGLPDGSGLDVMRALRDRYAGRAIALTGYGMESDIAASREAGFAEHLTKPVDLAALDAAIRRVARAVA